MHEQDYKGLVKKYFIFLLILEIIITIFLPVIFYITDPLQIFHKSWFQNDRLNWNMREQAAGIINNFDFDSIILGTSMLENTSAKEANEKIGGNFVNVSISGSNYYERSFVLRKALKKKIKNVLYSMDSVYIDCPKEKNDFKTKYWIFLYDDSKLNDIRYYFQKQYLVKLYNPYTATRKVDIDRPNAWYETIDYASRFDGLEKWVEHIDNDQVQDFLLKELPKKASAPQNKDFDIIKASAKLELAKKYIDEYILQYVKKYNNTKFFLIFPPYFRYTYADWAQHNYETFYIHQEIIKFLANEASKYNNLYVYGFENENFLDDITNYMDTKHYHYKYNSYFLDEIQSNRHKITNDNVITYLLEAKNKAFAFDIAKLNNKSRELIKKIYNGKY